MTRSRQILNCTADILLLLFVAWALWLGLMSLPEIVFHFGAGR